MILIVGAGGVSQTYFMEFLKNNNVDINDIGDFDNLKHIPIPSNLNGIEKCIFLYNNPYYSLLSHFKKNRSNVQCKKLGNPYHLSEDILNNFDLFEQETLNKGKDLFGIEYQFNNWIKETKIPLMFLDFNDILDNKNELNIFINKQLDYDLFEIKERNYPKNKLYFIYEKLYTYMKKEALHFNNK